MELKDLRNMNVGELQDRVTFLKRELFDMRQQSRLGQVEKPSRFKTMRRQIAQVMTVINERKKSNGKKGK